MLNRARIVSSALVLACLAIGPASHAQDDSRVESASRGMFIEQGRPAMWYFDQSKKVNAALAALKPERKGVVDAYVVVAGIDADNVFGKEVAEVGKVLSQRFDATGRTIVLSASSAAGTGAQAYGNPINLMTVLGGVAAKMNLKEDVLVLYTTSHGSPGIGIVYKDGQNGFGMINPSRMADMLNGFGFTNKLAFISACYSGQFVPALKNDTSIVVTAASSERSSFGCSPGNDWTFFGDALVNGSMRTPMALDKTIDRAFKTISGWESKFSLKPSEPQVFYGDKSKAWLAALEKRMPTAVTKPVGKPAIDNLGTP